MQARFLYTQALRNSALITMLMPINHLMAAEAKAPVITASGSMTKMVIGLGLVLAVMFGIAWLAKKILPHSQAAGSAIKVVGGVSVGTRERVMVLEVAGRWLVVGVASGQVSAIADLAPDPELNLIQASTTQNTNQALNIKATAFKDWLKQAMKK